MKAASSGEYFLIIPDEYDRYQEVFSTKIKVVIPTLDKVVPAFGIPQI